MSPSFRWWLEGYEAGFGTTDREYRRLRIWKGAGGRILLFLFLDWKPSPPWSPFHSHSNLWHFRPSHFFFYTGAEVTREAVPFWLLVPLLYAFFGRHAFSLLFISCKVYALLYIYAIDNWCNIWIHSFISILFVSKSKPLSHFLENRVRMKSRFLSNILGSLLATRASCESHRLWHNTRGEGWLLGRKRVGGLGRCAISVKLQLTGWQGRGCAIIHNFSEFEKSCQTICAVTLPEDSFS